MLKKPAIYKWLLHGIVWVLFFYLNIYYLQNWLPTIGLHKTLWQLVLYSLIYLPVLFAAPYLHYFYLLPTFFLRKKYGWYILWLVLSFIAGSYLTAATDSLFLIHDKQNWLMTGVHVWSRIPLLVLFTLLAVWARLTTEFQKQLQLQQQSAQKQTEAELKWLKAQLSPHFLFNALNNIHSLVQLQHEKASPMLVKLSDMMRYVLKESEAQQVALHHEIAYLHNYIELQTLKQSWQHKINLEVQGDITGIQVAPLLFINFVENACKHSNLDEDDGFVIIYIEYADNRIMFTCKNSFKLVGRKDATSGIGISNIQNRLHLLYPGRHHLVIEALANEYRVALAIYN